MTMTGPSAGPYSLLAALLFGLNAPASAAGLSSPVDGTNWAGVYVGGQLGGGWSDTDWRYQNLNWFNTSGAVLVGTDFDIDGSGVLGGGQVGYNHQSGNWVFGVEGSLAGAGVDGSRPSPFFPALDRYRTDIDWLATVTGRAGYSQGRWLVYAKGGWAGADVELDLFDVVTPLHARSNTWANGWTVGGGGEYAFGNFSLSVEYGYVDLDTDRWTVRCPACPSGVGGGVPIVDGDVTIQSVTARLNYRFNK
jgi:outer membrane immunogenic protein